MKISSETYKSLFPLPNVNAPPWIHTMTGSVLTVGPDDCFGVYTFKYKQSSDPINLLDIISI